MKEERNRLQRKRDDEVDVGHRGGHRAAASNAGGSPRLSSLLHALDGGAHRMKAWPCATSPQPFVRCLFELTATCAMWYVEHYCTRRSTQPVEVHSKNCIDIFISRFCAKLKLQRQQRHTAYRCRSAANAWPIQ